MKYIIASIGRSGSTLVTNLIFQASGLPPASSPDLIFPEKGVLKTHLHFRGEPNFNYKAVFVFSRDITDVISSMYAGRVDMKRHLYHLEVLKRYRLLFKLCFKFRKILKKGEVSDAIWKTIFLYMIKDDKFRFKENALSWKLSKNVLFVAYEDLCESKDQELRRISNFLEIKLPDFELKERQVKKSSIPDDLIDMAIKEYGDFFQTLTFPRKIVFQG